jgi:hypothetical protein
MSDQLPFLFSDTYTLEGYVPPFGYSDTLLNLESRRVQTGGRGRIHFGVGYDDDEGEPTYELRYSVTVLGVPMPGDHDSAYGVNRISQHDDKFTIAAKCVNAFLDNKWMCDKHPEAAKFLKENAKALNQSKRYWSAQEHLKEIAKEKIKLAQMQRKIQRAELVAQLKAFEVLEGRQLSDEERQQKWAEISGGLPYGEYQP